MISSENLALLLQLVLGIIRVVAIPLAVVLAVLVLRKKNTTR
jgi:hypothetical protein